MDHRDPADWRIGDHIDPADEAFLGEQMYAYNVATTGVTDGRALALVLRDDAGAIVAAVNGHTWGGTAEVLTLWVREDTRGRGWGRRLLALAEAEATARGCTQIILDTHSFQAPDFYLRASYEVFGTVEHYPPGHAKLYLRKSLPGRPGTGDGGRVAARERGRG